MSDEAAKFRRQADESREQAAKAVNPLDKEAWLRIAEEWLKLAISVEGTGARVRPRSLAYLNSRVAARTDEAMSDFVPSVITALTSATIGD
jgi:hypothetical protein